MGQNRQRTEHLDEYLSINQCCQLAGFSRSTWYNLLNDTRSGLSRIVFRSHGVGRYLARKDRFRSWLEGRKVG